MATIITPGDGRTWEETFPEIVKDATMLAEAPRRG
jgi:hypothetical protein